MGVPPVVLSVQKFQSQNTGAWHELQSTLPFEQSSKQSCHNEYRVSYVPGLNEATHGMPERPMVALIVWQ